MSGVGPFANQLHVDAILSNVSGKYRPSGFIAMDVFPELAVKKTSDLIRVYQRDFRIPITARALGGLANEHGFQVSTVAYALEKHSLRKFIDDDEKDNYDGSDLEVDVTEELTDKILMRLEKSVADLFAATSSGWSLNASLASAAQWSLDTITSNPVVRVDTMSSVILLNSGMIPNYAILPYNVYKAARNHMSVLDRLKYTTAEVDQKKIAILFGLQDIYIPSAGYDSGLEGLADSVSSIWLDNVFVGYKPAKPGPNQPSAGYTIRKSQPLVKKYRDEDRNSTVVEVNMWYQPKIISSLCGFLAVDALA